MFVVFEGYECNVTHMPHQASVCMGDPFGYFRLWSQGRRNLFKESGFYVMKDLNNIALELDY